MAITNHERVGKGLELLKVGLGPFVDREVRLAVSNGSLHMDNLRQFVEDPILQNRPITEWDVAGLLKLMWETWNQAFRIILGQSERNLVSELRTWRNKWAHQEPFSGEDADRALDSTYRLLTAISAPQADEVNKLKQELRRQIYDEQVRSEKRKSSGSLIDVAANSAIKPWREVIAPHSDVATGQYQQAEFAADLWQVHIGEGTDEYRKPAEFFRRTYLTESLKQLLVGAVKRLNNAGGDPVVQLQTNFGGGKTHSMLALYHLVSGTPPGDLLGIGEMLAAAGLSELPRAKRVVLVGNKISPGNPSIKKDGTKVHTLWGELAYQLGGKEAYDRIALDDQKATNPGDVLRELMVEYGPCLILVDEWVAYARQLHDTTDLPAGTFETHFSFAQTLTESAKLASNCLLVISLPASDANHSPFAEVDDVEVGGIRGREALERLRRVVGRVESSWRPATAEEGFEIVRRRLFTNLDGAEAFKQRDVTARAFCDFYRANKSEFPRECSTADYEARLQAAYPIHPEVFDRLYGDWSTLVKFQRTRGVLRLMAAVIHSLWISGDKSPLIMPSLIPIDDQRVQFELTRYLSDVWIPIIERDVDGPNSLPQRIDQEVPNLGKLSATRRVARTVYFGSAPLSTMAQRGVEDNRINLGCVVPGESIPVFGDALRRLASRSTYMYKDENRAWFDTQPTVTKLAEDRATDLLRNLDAVKQELETRLRDDARTSNEFSKIHVMPGTGADVADDIATRLVILSSEYPYSREPDNAAQLAAQQILDSRGNAPRKYKNSLVFAAADKTRLPDLNEAVAKYLAWKGIHSDKDALNLSPHQVRQVESQLKNAGSTVNVRIPEVYKWVMTPEQETPHSQITWNPASLSGQESIASRVIRRLKTDDRLVASLGSSVLRNYLDTIPLWREDSIAISLLVDYFASYPYLPRLIGPGTLTAAVSSGIALLTWQSDSFAYAESYDLVKKRFIGLRCGQAYTVTMDDRGLLVKPDVARAQLDQEAVVPPEPPPVVGGIGGTKPQPSGGQSGGGTQPPLPPIPPPVEKGPNRFFGTVTLDASRVGRDAAKVAEEVIAHLLSEAGAGVSVTLEIQASFPDGASIHTVRTVTENGRTLRFDSQGFDKE